MSRTKHERGKPAKRRDHVRKNKEWKHDSSWKKKERPLVRTKPRTERRSPRTRQKK